MTHKTHDLAVKLGEYTNSAGETKGRWKNIGSVLKFDDGGTGVLLDRTFNPAGVPNPEERDTVLISVFSVNKDNQQQGQQQQAQPPQQQSPRQSASQQYQQPPQNQKTDFDDDIPF
jgi:hypothetical protein